MTMRQYIQKIATGPELSKDLSREEASDGMRRILSGDADPVQAAIFLIALRMKRETMPENLGVLDALLEATNQVTAAVDDILDLSDPFDGFTRGMPAAPFLPPVLAACGIATVANGAESIGPKYGATHRKVLRAAGVNVDLSSAEAARQLEDDRIGWAYVDQRAACPKLHELVSLRTKIVKRPCLTTLEVLLGPVRGVKRTHLLTGYVHKPYPPIYTALARASGYDSAIIVRGVEGGVIPSLNQPSKLFCYQGEASDREVRLDPAGGSVRSDCRPAQGVGRGDLVRSPGHSAARAPRCFDHKRHDRAVVRHCRLRSRAAKPRFRPPAPQGIQACRLARVHRKL